MTVDPIGSWADSANLGNPYAYVGNNPASAADPSGQLSLFSTGAGGRGEAYAGGGGGGFGGFGFENISGTGMDGALAGGPPMGPDLGLTFSGGAGPGSGVGSTPYEHSASECCSQEPNIVIFIKRLFECRMIMMMLDLAERHEADAYEDESGEPYHVGGDTAAGQLEWVDDVEKAEAENMDAEGLASFLSDHHVQERGTFTFRLVTSGIMIETSGVFMINTTSGRIVALRERRNRTENYHHSHRKYCNQKAQAITRLFSWMHVISGFHTHPAGNTWMLRTRTQSMTQATTLSQQR
ncbi:MAG: hypothetical protein IPM29_32805 [Planctomycetes bacterium]|nr:hypothetical protein [Planctomycetota bacterium]